MLIQTCEKASKKVFVDVFGAPNIHSSLKQYVRITQGGTVEQITPNLLIIEMHRSRKYHGRCLNYSRSCQILC